MPPSAVFDAFFKAKLFSEKTANNKAVRSAALLLPPSGFCHQLLCFLQLKSCGPVLANLIRIADKNSGIYQFAPNRRTFVFP